MAELQTKTIIDPDLGDLMSMVKQDMFATMNCVKVGQVKSFDATKKTAQVQVLFKRVLNDGTITSYPVMIDCPVFTLQGGGGSIQFPIAQGDYCLVLYSDRRLDEWFQNGVEAAPGDPRMHDFSDGIILVGLNPLSNSGPVAPSDKVQITYQGTTFEITSTGWSFIGTGGGEIDVTSLVTIKNNTTTLLTLLDNFITLLEGLTVQDPISGPIPLTAASIALLEAFKAQFATLLG